MIRLLDRLIAWLDREIEKMEIGLLPDEADLLFERWMSLYRQVGFVPEPWQVARLRELASWVVEGEANRVKR